MNGRTDYVAALGSMYGRAATGIKLGLANMRAALDLLGHPESRMRHVVVAGTNGKGSTTTLIAGALESAGHRVGRYTSPHLLRFTERIRSHGQEMAPERVAPLYERIAALEARLPQRLTFFEVATVMAFLVFAEDQVDIAVLEVGLGGRLDAVNVVSKLLSVITPIGIDHERYLGTTLSAIAAEKAGIIEPGVPVVSAPQDPEALGVIAQRAEALGAPLAVASAAGRYPEVNAATAALAVEKLASLGIMVGPGHFAAARARFDWPGRYQWIGAVLLDGAHNGHGVAALLAAMERDQRAADTPMHLIATVLADKDHNAILKPVAARAASVQLVPTGSDRTRSMGELATLGFPVAREVADALTIATRRAESDGGFVLVTGSLFLVADALAVLTASPRDPPIDG